MLTPRFSHVHLIVNAASGADTRTDAEVVEVLDSTGVTYTRHDVTAEAGPAVLAARAAASGADLMVAAGGDGTVAGVAHGLIGTGVPLAIVPRGTANVFAAEMGVPADVPGALALVSGTLPARIRAVDVGRAESGAVFLLRMGIGLEAAMVARTPDAAKARWGRLAYARTLAREVWSGRRVRYRVAVDGHVHTARGVTCVVCNSASLGVRGLDVLPDVRVDDGLLDVVVLRGVTLRAAASVIYHALRSLAQDGVPDVSPSPAVRMWRGRFVAVAASHAQVVACDGEPIPSAFPVRASVLPGALGVLVPDLLL